MKVWIENLFQIHTTLAITMWFERVGSIIYNQNITSKVEKKISKVSQNGYNNKACWGKPKTNSACLVTEGQTN